MTLWELVSLELDKPAEEIGRYFEEQGIKIRRVKNIRKPLAKKKTTICKIVNKALGNNQKRKLVVYGSGSYHHFTYGLCRHADKISDNYGYIHFDHHDDSYEPADRSTICCAGFVRSIIDDTNASRVLYIGAYQPGFRLPIAQELLPSQLREECSKEFKESLAELPKEVYLSFDLDVMDTSVIWADYCQGMLKTKKLMRLISMIKKTKHIIGADVLGYAAEDRCDNSIKTSGKELYARIIKSLLKA